MTTLAPQATMRFSYGHPVATVPVLWRVESRLYSTIVDAEREEFDSRPEVEALWFVIVKETACGHWIDYYGEQKFVLARARKCFARPSVKNALEDFIARKKRQRSIYLARANVAETCINIAQHALLRLNTGEKDESRG